MMVQVGHSNSTGLNTARSYLAGAGTQTSAVAIWWYYWKLVQEQQKNTNGSTWATSPGSMNTARQGLAGSVNGTQTAALALVVIHHLIQEQQNNMMEHLGQHETFSQQQEVN
jgi:hypothetical protein